MVLGLLLEDLKSLNLFCIGYADNVVNVIRSKFINTISSIMTGRLRCVQKTLIAENIRFFNRVLGRSENVKYLRVFFDSKLN